MKTIIGNRLGNPTHLHMYEITVAQYPGQNDVAVTVYANNQDQAKNIARERGYEALSCAKVS